MSEAPPDAAGCRLVLQTIVGTVVMVWGGVAFVRGLVLQDAATSWPTVSAMVTAAHTYTLSLRSAGLHFCYEYTVDGAPYRSCDYTHVVLSTDPYRERVRRLPPGSPWDRG